MSMPLEQLNAQEQQNELPGLVMISLKNGYLVIRNLGIQKNF